MSTAENRAPAPAPDLDIDGVTRRSTLKWLTLAWVGFAAATGAGLTATMRFMFPNVLFEPPTRFKGGDPSTYAIGVDERHGRRQSGHLQPLITQPLISLRRTIPESQSSTMTISTIRIR